MRVESGKNGVRRWITVPEMTYSVRLHTDKQIHKGWYRIYVIGGFSVYYDPFTDVYRLWMFAPHGKNLWLEVTLSDIQHMNNILTLIVGKQAQKWHRTDSLQQQHRIRIPLDMQKRFNQEWGKIKRYKTRVKNKHDKIREKLDL